MSTMQTIQIILISSILSHTFAGKYAKIAGSFTDRDDAATACYAGHYNGLATILSVTDNHDARKTCDSATDGCWIGLKGTSCNTPACDNYVWDDGSTLSNYGFTAGVATNSALDDNAFTNPDGPWKTFAAVAGTSCVYTDGTNSATNDMANAIWILGSCNDGTARAVICNEPIGGLPPYQLFYYAMIDDSGASGWVPNPIANANNIEQPLTTNSDRCRYANANVPPSSFILQGCWGITNDGANSIIALEHFESTETYGDCQLQFNIDPWSSTSGQECLVEYTVNGTSWIGIGAYGNTAAETYFVDLPMSANNNPLFGVRVTLDPTATNSISSECYFNHFYLRCYPATTTGHPTTNDGANSIIALEPTAGPAEVPTPGPTPNPTTKRPTPKPTAAPTTEPTEPTVEPTERPTKSPTKNPTTEPTIEPTEPTVEPTTEPTPNPTPNPTQITTEPTPFPTTEPTEERPTKSPTKTPTTEPTEPTVEPTERPTKSPTKNLTKSPIKSPTRSPTKSPTNPGTCDIGKQCDRTEDCCGGLIDERDLGITCSCLYKLSEYWTTKNKDDKRCCIKIGWDCTDDVECCNRKGMCYKGKCTNKQNIPKGDRAWIDLEAIDNEILEVIDEVETNASVTEIIITIFVIFVIIAILCFICMRCCRKKRRGKNEEANDDELSSFVNIIELNVNDNDI